MTVPLRFGYGLIQTPKIVFHSRVIPQPCNLINWYTTTTHAHSEAKLPRGGSSELRDEITPEGVAAAAEKAKTPKMTLAESDDELRRKLEEISGDGGASGVETEDGKPATMKRAVRNNMFRYI